MRIGEGNNACNWSSMVARVTTPVVEEGYTTTTWKDSKAEGEEKVWGFIIVEEASKTKGEEEVYTIDWEEESIREKEK